VNFVICTLTFNIMKNKKIIIIAVIFAICIFVFLLKIFIKKENKNLQIEEKIVSKNIESKTPLKTPEPFEEIPAILTQEPTNKVRNIPDTQSAIIPLDDPVPDDDYSVYIEEALKLFRSNATEEEKEKALENMIAINHPMAIPVIMLALEDKDEYIRGLAIEALKFINHPDVIPAVEKALDDENSEIRQDSLESLMLLKDESISSALTKALNDDDPTVRESVFEIMLMQDSPELIPVAKTALQSDKSDNQINAISALEDIPATEAIDAIINYGLLSNFDSARDEALDSLRNISGQDFSSYEDWNSWWNGIKTECPSDGNADSWDKWWYDFRNQQK